MAVDPKVLEARRNPKRSEKACSVCGKTKPIDEYHLGGSTVDGRASACKFCATRRTRRWMNEQAETVSVPPAVKKCSGCLTVKPFDEFHRSRSSPTGLQTYCVTCAKLMGRGMTVKQIRTALGLDPKRVRSTMSYKRSDNGAT